MKTYIINSEGTKNVHLDKIERIDSEAHYFAILHETEFELNKNKFGITENIVINPNANRNKLGLETFKNYYAINIGVLRMFEGKVIVDPVVLVFGKNFVIAIANEQIEMIDSIEQEIIHKHDILLKDAPNPSNKLIFLIFDELINRGLALINELEHKCEIQEDKTLRVGKSVLANELITLRRQVYKLRRNLNHMTYVCDVILLNENKIINPDMIQYFNVIDIKFTKLDGDINELYQSIASLRDAYEAELSNQLNQVMKVFTMISTIFLPLTLVAGIYGMNFNNMPELGYKYGYFMVLAFMVTLAGVMVFLFKRKKWL